MAYNDIPGLLLVNLGTPDSPSVADVRRYLREFLSDPRVIDIPSWKRWLILNLFILPFRPRQSAEAYATIWDERGSPLLYHSRDLAGKVQERLGDAAVVDLAMRYGEPSVANVLAEMRRLGVRRIVVFPLYPQYSSATTGSTIEKVCGEISKMWNTPYVQIVPPFYDHPAFLDSYANSVGPVIGETDPERVFFSFHGLPERQVRKGDPSGAHCLRRDGCCDAIGEVNADCYRAQCLATGRLLADRLGVPQDRRVFSFQSRLGREPWLSPYTDEVVREAAQRGIQRAVILSPAFVTDCLETLEELGIRAAEDFKAHGGESLTLAPAPNSSDTWADAVVRIARESSPWL